MPASAWWANRDFALRLCPKAQAGDPHAVPHAAQVADSTGVKPYSLNGAISGPRASVAPRLLTLRQAAAYLAVSYWTVRSWVESGRLPAVKLPGSRLIRVERAALDALIEECRIA